MARARILIPGGYGVFGRLLARELLDRTDAEIVIAGRDARRAAAMCDQLGDRAIPLELDLTQAGAVGEVARGCFAVACCAGPFQSFSTDIIGEALAAGAHWLDVADETRWVTAALRDPRTGTVDSDRAVMPGLSSIPLLGMVLLGWCLHEVPKSTRARAGLFIGDRNVKGAGSIGSALATGFGEPAAIRYPFGTRRGYRFSSPLEELARHTGISVDLYVTLGSRLAGRFVHAASPVLGASRRRAIAARVLAAAAGAVGGTGARGGAVVVDLTNGAESFSACLVGDDQRFAILPIAIAIEELLAGREAAGPIEASGWLTPDEWIRRVRARGVRLFERRASPFSAGETPAG